MSLMKDLSILRRSMGNLRNDESDDDLVPKSSRVIVAPRDLSRSSLPLISGSSSCRVPSVSSKSRFPNENPLSATICSTRFRKSDRRSWYGEMLTAIFSSGLQRPCQALPCSQARRRRKAPKSWMRPISSARGMKTSGEAALSGGLLHRARASSPMTRPVEALTIGW